MHVHLSLLGVVFMQLFQRPGQASRYHIYHVLLGSSSNGCSAWPDTFLMLEMPLRLSVQSAVHHPQADYYEFRLTAALAC